MTIREIDAMLDRECPCSMTKSYPEETECWCVNVFHLLVECNATMRPYDEASAVHHLRGVLAWHNERRLEPVGGRP